MYPEGAAYPVYLLSMLSVLSGTKIARKMDKNFKTKVETWLRVHLRVHACIHV